MPTLSYVFNGWLFYCKIVYPLLTSLLLIDISVVWGIRNNNTLNIFVCLCAHVEVDHSIDSCKSNFWVKGWILLFLFSWSVVKTYKMGKRWGHLGGLSVKQLHLAWVMIPGGAKIQSHIGSLLSREPASPSAWAHALSLSLWQIYK